MRCAFTYTGEREGDKFLHRCERCQAVRASKYENPALLKAECGAAPSIIQRVANFAGAAVTHVRTGRKRVADEVREHRLATCQACPLLVDGVCSHPNCGCPIRNGRAWIDKLSWESSRCPLAKWKE